MRQAAKSSSMMNPWAAGGSRLGGYVPASTFYRDGHWRAREGGVAVRRTARHHRDTPSGHFGPPQLRPTLPPTKEQLRRPPTLLPRPRPRRLPATTPPPTLHRRPVVSGRQGPLKRPCSPPPSRNFGFLPPNRAGGPPPQPQDPVASTCSPARARTRRCSLPEGRRRSWSQSCRS